MLHEGNILHNFQAMHIHIKEQKCNNKYTNSTCLISPETASATPLVTVPVDMLIIGCDGWI